MRAPLSSLPLLFPSFTHYLNALHAAHLYLSPFATPQEPQTRALITDADASAEAEEDLPCECERECFCRRVCECEFDVSVLIVSESS